MYSSYISVLKFNLPRPQMKKVIFSLLILLGVSALFLFNKETVNAPLSQSPKNNASYQPKLDDIGQKINEPEPASLIGVKKNPSTENLGNKTEEQSNSTKPIDSLLNSFRTGDQHSEYSQNNLVQIEDKIYTPEFDKLADKLGAYYKETRCTENVCELILSKKAESEATVISAEQFYSFATFFNVSKLSFNEENDNILLYIDMGK